MRVLALLVALAACHPAAPADLPVKAVVIISANAEWAIVKQVYPDVRMTATPWGETFERVIASPGFAGARSDAERRGGTINGARVVYLHGGWGKVAAAGSAQYAIDRWHPRYVINLGTCGGFEGAIERHAVVLANRTVIYDIKEAMGDSAEAIRDYSVDLDLSWLTGAPPSAVTTTLLVSGDRDLVPGELGELAQRYRAVAGDWESGAIAYTCARNHQRVLILRGVTDVVSAAGSPAYGSIETFQRETGVVMRKLLDELPAWLARCP